jgi:hypothetical protein
MALLITPLSSRLSTSDRFFQALLISSVVALSWMGMMAVHELGHALHAWISGGAVVRVILHPAAFSRTDVSPNPQPQLVAWGGAIWGCLLPLAAWAIVRRVKPAHADLAAFFAGFCLIANGAYLGVGAFSQAGDAGDLLAHGARRWQLVLFGLIATAAGLYLWNGLAAYFGLGPSPRPIDRRAAVVVAIACLLLAAAELALG